MEASINKKLNHVLKTVYTKGTARTNDESPLCWVIKVNGDCDLVPLKDYEAKQAAICCTSADFFRIGHAGTPFVAMVDGEGALNGSQMNNGVAHALPLYGTVVVYCRSPTGESFDMPPPFDEETGIDRLFWLAEFHRVARK